MAKTKQRPCSAHAHRTTSWHWNESRSLRQVTGELPAANSDECCKFVTCLLPAAPRVEETESRANGAARDPRGGLPGEAVGRCSLHALAGHCLCAVGKAFVQRDLPGPENYHHVLSHGTRQLACAQLSHCAIWLRIRCRNRQFAPLNLDSPRGKETGPCGRETICSARHLP